MKEAVRAAARIDPPLRVCRLLVVRGGRPVVQAVETWIELVFGPQFLALELTRGLQEVDRVLLRGPRFPPVRVRVAEPSLSATIRASSAPRRWFLRRYPAIQASWFAFFQRCARYQCTARSRIFASLSAQGPRPERIMIDATLLKLRSSVYGFRQTLIHQRMKHQDSQVRNRL